MVSAFEAQLVILELLEHNPIVTVGYRSVLHIHTIVEECEVTKLLGAIDMKTKETKKVGVRVLVWGGWRGFRRVLQWGREG
jgi:peptide chain release factor subunit 3